MPHSVNFGIPNYSGAEPKDAYFIHNIHVLQVRI